ncbi:terminase small subunit [Phreatobacter oligotrophus]|uniref:Phage terminase small subunit n=1 Tax=Phreatobacter oligotrophus TaxID=1122261 RepID=A0A2T4ZIT0_9HYPH|nr:terminase small subunit [Phreatobacter oligotrophus]PTM61890.1 phage terminase small subunit [Phreatobacter oligotrophus]
MPKRRTPTPPPQLLDDNSAVEGLTYREELFAHLYVETANASEAYRRAGGMAKRPDQAASQMMAKPHVAKRISELRTRRLAAIEFNATEVLSRLIAQVRADLSDIFDGHGAVKPIHEWPDVWRTGLIAGIEVVEEFDDSGDERVHIGYIKKVKVADRVKILELAGRHVDINAWKATLRDLDVSDTLRAMLEHFSRDTWVNAPTGETGAPKAPSAAAPASPSPAPGMSILDGR